jgi:hypothetical protein
MTTSSIAPPRLSTGRRYFWLGLGLALLGIIAYLFQLVVLKYLVSPWYLPVTGTLGALLLLASVWQRRGVWRVVVLLLVTLLAIGEWRIMIKAQLPPYMGPVVVGKPMPAFATQRADGTPFSQRDLEGKQNTVLVFFRGRW